MLCDWSTASDLEDDDVDEDADNRLNLVARKLGEKVAIQEAIFTELLPDLLRGGSRAWSFGRGLADSPAEPRAIWSRFVEGLQQIAAERRDVQVLAGFLFEFWEKDRGLAQGFLDSAVDQPALQVFLPYFHSVVGLDERGVERLNRALSSGLAPISAYECLALGRATDAMTGGALKDLLLLIADQPSGATVALKILRMRLFADRTAQRMHDPDLLDAGRQLARLCPFAKGANAGDHNLAEVVNACFATADAGPAAGEVMTRLKLAVEARSTDSFRNMNLMKALLKVQPTAVLDALFGGDENGRQAAVRMFDHLPRSLGKPADIVSSDALVDWCNRDWESRYPLAAEIVTFARRSEESSPLVWSDQAKALLASAPDPKRVLAVFIKRFRPMSWSGSRAAVMESYSQLLDSLGPNVPSEVMSFAGEAKSKLAQEIATERRWETERDQENDERFE